jgi:sugar phosphate isomerase/epimerase
MMRLMDPIQTAINDVKRAADAKGLRALADESGVKYTTIKSFHDRDWSHKNLEVLRKLADAARRLNGAA